MEPAYQPLTDAEWQGILQRAIARVEGWDTPAWHKAKPLKRLRGIKKVIDARIQAAKAAASVP